MRSFVGLRWLAWTGMLFAAGCGGGESSPEAECVGSVCPCTEGGVRAAVAEGGGPYSFDCDGPSTVVIRAEIIIDRDVTLNGGGELTLDGNRRHRVFSVLQGAVVELVGFTIINGRVTDENGGAIRNEGTLMLTSSAVSNSSAGDDAGCRTDDRDMLCSEGGGIWNAGTLTLSASTVSANAAHFGGGIANRGGNLTLINSEVLASSARGCRGVGAVVCSGGGGIWNSGTLTMEDSNVSGSSADWGAGIYNRGNFVLTRSSVSENAAGFDGGGLLNFEVLRLLDSTVADNVAGQSGGGIANEAGLLEVTSSTLVGNVAASAGGGIFTPVAAAAELVNTTLSANTADSGGGLYSSGDLLLLSSTMVANDAAAGSAVYDPGTPNPSLRSITNTLVVGDCAGEPFDSGGHNIESPGNTCGFDQESDQPGTGEPDLGPLADNGGPTLTHALLEGSAAIDRIPESSCIDKAGEPLTTDQRGEPRPAGASAACDVGAFEAQPPLP